MGGLPSWVEGELDWRVWAVPGSERRNRKAIPK